MIHEKLSEFVLLAIVATTAVAQDTNKVMDADTIRAGLESHDRALYIKSGWIRDPYITVGPDDFYCLTGTQPNPGEPREAIEPYNTGLGDGSIVGEKVRLWRSKDLIDWEYLGEPFTVDDTIAAQNINRKIKNRLIWCLRSIGE